MIEPAIRSLQTNIENISPFWLAGFCSGESNFFITLSKKYVSLRFSIGQDSRDLLLLDSILKSFNCGYVYKYKNREVCELVVTKSEDLTNIIIPFFEKYVIKGSKYSDFNKFKKAALMIKDKKHLNDKGFDKIIEIKNFMNKNN